MNRTELEKILPHRPPMLLLDESEVVDGEAHGRLAIHGDEFFLQGHFPNNPIVPGTGLDKVRFKSSIRPGDTIDLVCRLTRERAPFYFAEGEASVNGRLCCKASMSFALVDATETKGGER